MALTATLHRFHLSVADVDRSVYETLELRVPRHPSEGVPYLLTRVIAYALNVREGLAMTDGLCVPDEPALRVTDLTGAPKLVIEIGNPSAERLHKAMKAAGAVRVYTYRDPAILLTSLADATIHKRERVEIFSLPPAFLDKLGATLARDNDWELLHTGGELTVTVGETSFTGELKSHSL